VLIPVGDSRVQDYDFRNQEIIDRSRIRRFQPVIEVTAQRMAGVLSANLRKPVHVTMGGFEQKSWDEFRAEMEDPTFIVGASLIGLDGRVALHVPVELVLALVEVQLGGTDGEQPDRLVLTDLELELIGSMAEDMLSGLQSAVDAFFELGVAALQRHQSSIYVKMGRPGEMCLQVQMSVAIAEGRTRTMSLYFPLTVLHPILDAFERLQREEGVESEPRWASAEKRLLSVPVEIQVSYPPIGLTTTEVLGLRIGDVIPLYVDKDDREARLDIVAGGYCIGKGFLATEGKRLACTVTSWREEGI
jgi:flagellar motor switch protein FliM